MEYLHNFAMYIGRFLPFQETQPPRENTRIEAYFNSIYKVLSWEQPKLSSIILVALLVFLWLIVQLEIKFYGVIFFTILIIMLGDYYLECKNFQVEDEGSTEFLEQMVCYFYDIMTYLKTVRTKHPMPFCIVMCVLFLCLTVIARNVSGITLTYLGLIGVFIVPALISRLPPEYAESFKECLHTIGSTQGVLAESELIPFLSLKEHDNDLDSLKTDRTLDSLISGISSMPSYLEAEKDPEEDELEIPIRLTRESSTDTDSDRKSMNFDSLHFNGDSSSEDESLYRKGLKFTDADKDLPASNSRPGILSNLTAIGSNLISTVLNAQPKRKDSDSDFEIIDSDEAVDS